MRSRYSGATLKTGGGAVAESKGCSVVVVALMTALAFVVGAAAGVGVMWYTAPPPADAPAPVVTAPDAQPTEQGPPYPAAFPLPETLRVEGPLTDEVVREVVLGRRPELRECYQAGLERDPSLKGEISLQFTVTAPLEPATVPNLPLLRNSTHTVHLQLLPPELHSPVAANKMSCRCEETVHQKC